MVFKCQEDSFLKEFTTKVVSCEKSTLTLDSKKLEGYNLILEDTILFPEGGGQPCDYGEINDKPVWDVVRRGADAVHFVESTVPFQLGDLIDQKLNWKRRLDHMQQHSGQHLITALFDKEYGYDTKSWSLGNDVSYIQLDTKGETITPEQLKNIESMSNDLIFHGTKVEVTVTTKEDLSQLPGIRTRGLPADHTGPVRVITIDGIESNMCCGTHVTNLSQLQGIKLLNAEKAKNKVLLHFLVGQRVMKRLDECYKREMMLTDVIKNGPNLHVDLVQKLLNNFKSAQKTVQRVLKDLAIFEADKLKKKLLDEPEKSPKYYTLHRSDGIEPDFINTFLRSAPEGLLYFLTVSESTGKTGQMVIRGGKDQADIVRKFGDEFMALLDGKGSGSANQFQGKFSNVKKIPNCEQLLKEHFENGTVKE